VNYSLQNVCFPFCKCKNAVKEFFAVKRKIKPLAETTPSGKTV
jgi:hypothetical protein